MSVNTTSGDVKLKDSKGLSEVDIETTSGDIELDGFSATNTIHLSSVSGEIAVKGCESDSFSAETVSGDMTLDDLTVSSGNTELDTTSGDIDLDKCSLCSADIETVSGDVSGNIIGKGHVYVTDTTSGDVRVPNGQNDTDKSYVIRITTVSGDIKIGAA